MISRSVCSRLVVAAALSTASACHAQITLGQIDDFGDGTTQGWSAGGSLAASLSPANIGGELQLSTNGASGGPGNSLVAFNSSQWAGDYLAAGVTGLLLDIDNSDNDADLNLRLGLLGPGGGFATNDVVVPALSSVDGVLFELTPANLIGLGISSDLSATLAGVTELRIVHNPVAASANNGNAGGAPIGAPPIAATVRFDNLTAVPEPGAAALALLGTAAGAAGRRRRRNGR